MGRIAEALKKAERERRAAEKASEVEMQKLAHAEHLKQIKIDLAFNETVMFSMHCPIANAKCNNDCIHFTPGRGGMSDAFGEVMFYHSNPSCKLWKS